MDKKKFTNAISLKTCGTASAQGTMRKSGQRLSTQILCGCKTAVTQTLWTRSGEKKHARACGWTSRPLLTGIDEPLKLESRHAGIVVEAFGARTSDYFFGDVNGR